MNLKERRQKIWEQCKGVQLCAVTKGRTIEEIQSLITDLPDLKIIGENRWPDCQEKFTHFTSLKRHFIGPLQSNKLNKVLPIIDCLQSVDSESLLARIVTTPFLIQVNISRDPAKSGIDPGQLRPFLETCIKAGNPPQGLMTILAQEASAARQRHFATLRDLFDQINSEYFAASPMPTLSMGMSSDYELAIQEGATMVRLGSCLF